MEVMDIILNLQSELRKRDGYQITDIQDVGTDLMINCPFHGGGRERNPSFGILKEDKYTSQGKLTKGYGNCFACGAKMNLHTLVERTLKITPDNADHWLKQSGYTTQTNKLFETLTSIKQDDEKIVISDSTYTKGYIPYMKDRGIRENVAEAFDLGYTHNSMVIPIKDRHGTTRMHIHRFIEPINGRKFHNTSGAEKDELLHGRWELLQYPTMLQREYLFIVESSIDMMLMWQYGYPAVATMQAIPTQKQLDQIQKLPFKNIIVATDNDNAGHNAVERYLQLKDKNIFRLQYLPHEKDIGDLTDERLREMQIVQIQETKQKSPFGELPLG